jgi:hypothetical protein
MSADCRAIATAKKLSMLKGKKAAMRIAAGVAVIFNVGLGSALAQEHSSIWIKDNGSTVVTGYLLQGEDVQGLCDEDCNDMDLILYNEMGVMVDSDHEIDASPIVTAPYEGTFAIEISVPSCTHMVGCEVSVSSSEGF